MKSLIIVAVALYTTTHSPKAPPALAAKIRAAESRAKGPSEEYRAGLARQLAKNRARKAAKAAEYRDGIEAASKADRTRQMTTALSKARTPEARKAIMDHYGVGPALRG